MRKNVGPTDRFLRLILGAGLFALSMSGQVEENREVLLLPLAVLEVFTAASEYCPFYQGWDYLSNRLKGFKTVR